MQRLHGDDLAGRLLEHGGWQHLNLPVIVLEDEAVPIEHGKVHRRRVDDVLHPDHVPQERLETLKRGMGAFHLAAQYLQCPVPLDGNVSDWEWLRSFSVPGKVR